MINNEEFRKYGHLYVDWIADYLSNVNKFPVRSQVNPGYLKSLLPEDAPMESESMDAIFTDFEKVILPGITHWQNPHFFAYFPANTSEPSLLAEFLIAGLGVQGMKWVTSPAATELEEIVMLWLQKMLSLPNEMSGVIMDTASISTLCAILAARERSTEDQTNRHGIGKEKLVVYCSDEAHSSVEKAVRIAGIGSNNLRKIEVDAFCRLMPDVLENSIKDDLENGLKPCCIIGALGTTGTCAIDPLEKIGQLAKTYNCWFHVDAAFAGTALLLPEFRKQISGLELADSFVFNPHKWMFTHFDCSVLFVRDKEQLQSTFRLVPPYLQTQTNTGVNDYSNWGIHLGRRFRALKLWFVIRNFGIEGLQEKIREHIQLAQLAEKVFEADSRFEVLVPRNLAVVCFRFVPFGITDEQKLNEINATLLEKLNVSGKIFLSHTLIHTKFSLRLVTAQTHANKKHVEEAIATISMFADEMIQQLRS